MSDAWFGFVGVIIGAIITAGLPLWKDNLLRQQQALYLAARLICIFEHYVQQCIDIVQDDYDEDRSQSLLSPILSFPNDVDWKSIDSALMYRILIFQNRVQRTHENICCVAEFLDNDEIWEERHNYYCIIGLEALALIDLLSTGYGIANQKLNDEFYTQNPKELFEQKKQKIDERNQRRQHKS